MRISDWSSDVCSSDLLAAEQTKARVDILAINAQETVDDTRIVHRPAPSKNRRRSASHAAAHPASGALMRAAEHTSELQSLMRISYDAFCLYEKNMPSSA